MFIRRQIDNYTFSARVCKLIHLIPTCFLVVRMYVTCLQRLLDLFTEGIIIRYYVCMNSCWVLVYHIGVLHG